MALVDRITTEARAVTAGKSSLTLGGGQGFVQPPFWAVPDLSADWWGGINDNRESIENDFVSYVSAIYKANGIVAACIFARMYAFSEVRFAFRRRIAGRPNDLFSTGDLRIVERPWRNATTGELLARMEQDVSLAGNFYATTVDANGVYGPAGDPATRRVVRMRPDWVTIMAGSRRPNASPYDLDAEVIGYLYRPGGMINTPDRGDDVVLLPSQVCHYSPIPDPVARFRGMSWLTPVLSEAWADQAATLHKRKFFENNATLQTVVSLDASIQPDEFQQFVRKFNASHRGAANAYKTMFVGGGADVTVVGSNMRDMDFKTVQGGGETRVAAAAGVPPVWAGFSEGLQGSSLNAGNFGQARRRFADGTIRPLWRMASAAMDGPLVVYRGQGGDSVELTYDASDVAFLREDQADQANINNRKALTIEALIRAGYKPETVVRAVVTGDFTLLQHTGLFSVQLQPPTTEQNGGAGVAETPAPTEDDDDPDGSDEGGA